jgi:PAS domain S-box-containing protein
VQFYSDDSSLINELSRFIGAALGAGDSSIIIATRSHRDQLASLLARRGLDLASATEDGRYIYLDASDTLTKIMVDGWPDAARFKALIGCLLEKADRPCHRPRPTVAAFGEMVALLWAEGKAEAALHIEQLWNELAETRNFHLYCAYPAQLFRHAADDGLVQRICAQHSMIVPVESSATEDERLSNIRFLQTKAQALETEVLQRKTVQHELQEREAELRDFMENAIIGMHWVDANGIILWANKTELNLLGFAPEEYIGHHMGEFYVDRAVLEDVLSRLSREEDLHGFEAQMRAKDGSLRYVRVHSNVFRKDGRFVHTRCFTFDVTEEKQAEAAVHKLAAIVESSGDAIVSKDLNGIVTSWNAASERIFGFKADEMIGQSILRIIPPELHGDEEVILAKIRRGERIEHFQTVRQTKSGSRIDVSLTVSPVKDKRGKVIGAAKIARDVTEQKRLEKALHITEQLASVGRLAATVAHEINNPLESVTNLIYLAKTSPGLPDELHRYLDSADQELSRVAHIARQTLGFYRDNSLPVWLNVSDLIEDVLAIYQRKLKYKSLTVQKEVDPSLKLFALDGELKQVLSNLIANAIDASGEKGGKLRIAARRTRSPKTGNAEVRILIADHGNGIPLEDQKKLFTPFFTTKKEVGTGLGLWISRELIEKSGGQIRLRSRVGSGTVMAVSLPFHEELPAARIA